LSHDDTPRSAERVVAELLPSGETPIDQPRPLLVNPEVGAEMVNLSESTFYELLRTNKIRSFKVGRRRVIPVAAIEEWIAAELAEADGT
jgi:excisionase family DNA binding protein